MKQLADNTLSRLNGEAKQVLTYYIPLRFNLSVSSYAWPTVQELLCEQFHCAAPALISEAELFHLFDPAQLRSDPFLS